MCGGIVSRREELIWLLLAAVGNYICGICLFSLLVTLSKSAEPVYGWELDQLAQDSVEFSQAGAGSSVSAFARVCPDRSDAPQTGEAQNIFVRDFGALKHAPGTKTRGADESLQRSTR